MSSSIYEDLGNWAASRASSADGFIQQAIKNFYPKVVNDPRLKHFFDGANLDSLKRHQIAFMSGLFSGKEAGGFTSQQIYEIHSRLILDKGLRDMTEAFGGLPDLPRHDWTSCPEPLGTQDQVRQHPLR